MCFVPVLCPFCQGCWNAVQVLLESLPSIWVLMEEGKDSGSWAGRKAGSLGSAVPQPFSEAVASSQTVSHSLSALGWEGERQFLNLVHHCHSRGTSLAQIWLQVHQEASAAKAEMPLLLFKSKFPPVYHQCGLKKYTALSCSDGSPGSLLSLTVVRIADPS